MTNVKDIQSATREEMLACLKDLQERIESGEIVQMAYAIVLSNGHAATRWTGDAPGHNGLLLNAAVSMLNWRINTETAAGALYTDDLDKEEPAPVTSIVPELVDD